MYNKQYMQAIGLVALAIVLMAACVSGSGDHDHTSCACAAKEMSFTINCTAEGDVTTAFNYLQANSCASKCESDHACERNFFIIQSHHDHCLTIPDAVAKGIHNYEAACHSCTIKRQYSASLPACTQPTCSMKAPATDAFAALQANNCTTSCASTACSSAFKTIRAYHDMCDEDDLAQSVEEGIHDFEDACAAYDCNTSSGPFVPTCESTTSAAAASVASVAHVGFAALVALAVTFL
ncbi:uncharacterized protein AMSG_00626 [Thecamonas trahens ATCC 50062]|uniref:Uncharacterized protein n=1 Tax=Thecamonas trahens ATCC 50062 TaxID=461836 RepID=A0A0L0DGK1_THETB|nr:hypothetical protein AMSG_00626 [Thecamonas trahens ATCC 50062]KNC50463.1 hypothetical protein AMSG_00626 [Thecamonas trahens ATCC 50062]|eukprot:XP_013762359.1 hypothetical protein AMSG_00626 [Thecamonas trahens ATCC 50062]